MTQASEELPREVSRGTITLFGVQIDVIQLDDGRRVLDGAGFERLMNVMANDGLDLKNITPADAPEPQSGGTNDPTK
jgi:hypothetical protein